MNVLVQMLDAHLMRPRIVSTVRGAAKVAEEVKKRKLPIAVAVIPKTIVWKRALGRCWSLAV